MYTHTWYKCPYNTNGCWCPSHQLLRGSTANHHRGRFVKPPLSLTCSMYGVLPSWFMLGRACWFQKHSAYFSFGGSTKIDIWIFATLCCQFTAWFRLSYMNLAICRTSWNLGRGAIWCYNPPKSMVSCPPPAILSIVAIQPVG